MTKRPAPEIMAHRAGTDSPVLHRSGTNPRRAGVMSETVTAPGVTGLLVTDTFRRLALTNDGRVALWVLLRKQRAAPLISRLGELSRIIFSKADIRNESYRKCKRATPYAVATPTRLRGQWNSAGTRRGPICFLQRHLARPERLTCMIAPARQQGRVQ